jgi:hypothetical protein
MSQVPFLQSYRIEVFGWNHSVILYHVPTTVQNGRVFCTSHSPFYAYVHLCNFFQAIVIAVPKYSHRVESPAFTYFDSITGCDILESF